MVTIIAFVYGKKDKQEELKQSLLELGGATRKEEGNVQFIMHEREDDPSTFIFYESYTNEDTFQYHLNSPHTKKFAEESEKYDRFRADVEVIRLKKVKE